MNNKKLGNGILFHRNRKTKIVCTIGPASNKPQKIKELFGKGMDVARLNFSHGDYNFFETLIKDLRKVSPSITVMIDLPGPKIRTVMKNNEEIVLKEGAKTYLRSGYEGGGSRGGRTGKNGKPVGGFGEVKEIIVTDTDFSGVKISAGKAKNFFIYIDDGKIKLKILNYEPDKKTFLCKVIKGGIVRTEKGVNFHGIEPAVEFLTQKDYDAIDFGIKNKVDMFAVSFVRSVEDVLKARDYVKNKFNDDIFIVSKIEKAEAVQNLNSIIKASDGVMVARGDLGIETDIEKIGLLQKEIIRISVELRKPVITATQMLESMMTMESPTRAEVTDVTNAILDGTDTVMLSEETAIGANPALAVDYMDSIIKTTEKSGEFLKKFYASKFSSKKDVSGAVAEMAVNASFLLGDSLIAAVTKTGSTARLLSSLRPVSPIIAIVDNYAALRKLGLNSGVTGAVMKNFWDFKYEDIAMFIKERSAALMKKKRFNYIILCGGGSPGTTDFVRIFDAGAL